MDSKRFKRKKLSPPDVIAKFPAINADETYIGFFDGHSVSIVDEESISAIYNQGNFGKGSLSKSAPAYDATDDVPKILMQQQWENQLKWAKGERISANTSKFDDEKFITSIQNFLDTAVRNQTDTWKDWKVRNAELNRSVMCSSQCHTSNVVNETSQAVDVNQGYGVSNCSDPLFPLVEEILESGKIKVSKNNNSNNKVIVVEPCHGTDADESNISSVNIKLKNKLFDIKETLNLNLQEAFFLAFVIKCLKILDKNGCEMNMTNTWNKFCEVEKDFVTKYVAYHQYRTRGWCVKSGLKFGGDYLLYKTGPAYYHASYLVWLMGEQKKRMTWDDFAALNRLSETCNKDLLFCQVVSPNETESGPGTLPQYEVLEMVTKRWIPSCEREEKETS